MSVSISKPVSKPGSEPGSVNRIELIVGKTIADRCSKVTVLGVADRYVLVERWSKNPCTWTVGAQIAVSVFEVPIEYAADLVRAMDKEDWYAVNTILEGKGKRIRFYEYRI